MYNLISPFVTLQELVQVFNFHRYDNLRHAANKKDPRKQKFESRGQKVVSLLFSASTGDVTAMRRYVQLLHRIPKSHCSHPPMFQIVVP